MEKLTDLQQKTLTAICDYQQAYGMPPTRSEIAKLMGYSSVNPVQVHLKALANKGYIELLSRRSRNIKVLVGMSENDDRIPLIGQVAAGSPVLAIENIEDHFRCADLFSPRADYLLRVKGESMINVNIFHDDLVAVHKTEIAQTGQIVVARIDDEVTVKTFAVERNRIRLIPANDDYKPIIVDPQRHAFAIEGVVVGIIRRQNGV